MGRAVTVSKVGGIEARGRSLAVLCGQHKKDRLPGKVVAGDALGKLAQGGPVQLFFWPADHVGAEHRGFWRQAARKFFLQRLARGGGKVHGHGGLVLGQQVQVLARGNRGAALKPADNEALGYFRHGKGNARSGGSGAGGGNARYHPPGNAVCIKQGRLFAQRAV